MKKYIFCRGLYTEKKDEVVIHMGHSLFPLYRRELCIQHIKHVERNQQGKGVADRTAVLTGMLNLQLLAHLAEGIAHNVQLMPQLIHHAGNALGVFQDLQALCVWVVLHTKGALDGFCKLPIQVKKERVLQTSTNASSVCSQYQQLLFLTTHFLKDSCNCYIINLSQLDHGRPGK